METRNLVTEVLSLSNTRILINKKNENHKEMQTLKESPTLRLVLFKNNQNQLKTKKM